jgi:hypothetical protein
MEPEEFPDQTDIRPAGEFQLFESIGGAELGFEDFGESLHAGPAGANQRAVDIK